jgi:signal transduction histidine kinase/ActR/RegA family two-component response regulator
MPNHDARSVDGLQAAPGEQPAWQRIFRRSTPEGALQEIAAWMGAEHLELILEVSAGPKPDVVRYRGAGALPGEVVRRAEARVPGRPEWRLVASCPGSRPLSQERLERAAWALAAWRAARLEHSRADARLRRTTRDLDILQVLGRKGAEAKTPAELFAVVAASLHEGAGMDLVAVAHALAGSPAVSVFPSRPVADDDLDLLLRRTGVALGWPIGHDPVLERTPQSGFDAREVVRQGVQDVEWVRCPLTRRGKTIGEMILLPSEPLGEGSMRLAYGASNALSLHLDRILTVREAEKGRFRSILDSMPHAVFLTDPGLRVLQANRAAEHLLTSLGLDADDPGFHRVGSLDLRPLASDVLAGRSPLASGEARLDSGGLLAITLSALTSDDSRAEGLVLVLSDVTESRRMQDHLAQAEKLGSLGRMLSGIAHELNNPLATVLGFAQLVRGASADEKLAKRLATIHDEARRCQRIVQNLLRFARGREPDRRPFSLNEATEAVLNLMSYQLRTDGVEIVRELAPALPSVHGDAHDLQQAILNLLSNAHHAIRGAGRGGTIHVRTEVVAPERVALEVEDDGPGIPEGIRSKIFDPFFTTKELGQGTGLGLSLVYGTVASHGGSVRLVPDRAGTVFRIELPLGAIAPAAAAAGAPREDLAPAASARILVVDDEAPLAGLMCEVLAADGHRAESAADGREALHRLSEQEFDLVVSDVRMPGIGAARLRKEMEDLKPGLSSRLLLMTGDTVPRDADVLAAELGTDVLHKPFDLDDLRRAVRSRLGRNREH